MTKSNRLRKVLLFLAAGILSVAISCFAGCNKKQGPSVSDVTADVGDITQPVNVGDWEISSVEMDGKALSTATHYLITDGWLVWNSDYYGEWGVGEHVITFYRAQGRRESASFKVTVTDDKAPDYSFDMGFEEKTVLVGESVSLPVITRNSPYQNYDVTYTVSKSGEAAPVYSEENVENSSGEIVLEGLNSGDYTYTVSVIKGQEQVAASSALIKLRTEDEMTVEKDIFGAEMFSGWQGTADENSSIRIRFDSSEQAFNIIMSNSNLELGGRHYVAYMSADNFRLALSLGRKYLTFKMKASSDYISWTNSGVRFFGKVYDGLDGVQIKEGQEGIYLIQDFVTEELSTDYKSYYVNVKDVLEAHEDIKYFAINFNGANGSNMWFKNSEFITEEEYNSRIQNGDPAYNFDFGFAENATFSYGQAVNLPAATRLYPGQSYDIVYTLLSGGNTVKTVTDTDGSITVFEAGALEEGEYVYRVEIKKGDQIFETLERAFIVEDNVDEFNVFGEAAASGWNIVPGGNILGGFEQSEGAYVITMAATNSDINGRYYVAYYDISIFRTAVEKGYGYLSFEVKASAAYLNCAPYLPGVRIFGKVADGLDGVQIIDGQPGVYVIEDIRDDVLTADTYVTVTVDIAAVLEAHEDINYFALCVNGSNGGNIYFRNGSFKTTAD